MKYVVKLVESAVTGDNTATLQLSCKG